MENRRAVGARRAEALERSLRVSSHLLEALSTHQRPQIASVPSSVFPSESVPVRVVRSAALAQRSASGALPTRARIERAVHGNARLLRDELALLEPTHPSQNRVQAPTPPDRIRECENESSDALDVAGVLGMFEGRLGQVVRLVPPRRAR